ncbi:MAG: hypothetical protein WBY01_14950 [Pseudolabrys sp.]
MLKSVSICAALILAAAVFADSAEAMPGGFGGGRSMGGFGGARMGGFGGARMGGFSGARAMAVPGHGRMGFAGAGRFALCAWVRAELLGQAEVIGPATGGLAIGAGGIGAVDVSGPGA